MTGCRGHYGISRTAKFTTQENHNATKKVKEKKEKKEDMPGSGLIWGRTSAETCRTTSAIDYLESAIKYTVDRCFVTGGRKKGKSGRKTSLIGAHPARTSFKGEEGGEEGG